MTTWLAAQPASADLIFRVRPELIVRVCQEGRDYEAPTCKAQIIDPGPTDIVLSPKGNGLEGRWQWTERIDDRLFASVVVRRTNQIGAPFALTFYASSGDRPGQSARTDVTTVSAAGLNTIRLQPDPRREASGRFFDLRVVLHPAPAAAPAPAR